jgi:hypothetical protein
MRPIIRRAHYAYGEGFPRPRPARSRLAMNPRSRARRNACPYVVVALIAALLSGAVSPRAVAQGEMAAHPPAPNASAKIPADQLDLLVAQIALYTDSLLGQTLSASTYPLEVVQLQQWLVKHPGYKAQALADAVAKQHWDTSIQSIAASPEVVDRMANDIQWTTDLGNAYLAQRDDVMAAVQRVRKKAHDNVTFKTSGLPKVEREART